MLTVVFGLLSVSADGADSVHFLPGEFHLDGPEARHRILVERFDGEIARGAVPDCEFLTDNPDIAEVREGMLVARGNGTTTVRASVDGSVVVTASITVTGADEQVDRSFRNDVQPVLAKLGCNSGACHGALAGKGGFRLSLRGYDPERDYFNMTQQHLGRRVDLHHPGMSLILTKPTVAVAHKGGRRMDLKSRDYRIIADWIAFGADGPSAADATVERLEILPDRVVLKDAEKQPLIVRAHYSDGRERDVTHWATFTSTREAVVSVDESGTAQVVGPGEGAVTAWFDSQIAISRVTVSFDQSISPEVYLHAARRNFIDELVLKQLLRLNLRPSARCSDEVFIRRAFLNTIGVLPTAQEVREFLLNGFPDRRDRLINSLLERPEFVDYWTYRWSDVLMINGNLLRQEPVRAYYQWIRGHVENNTPWDQFARQLVTSRGSSLEHGGTNFFALHQKPEDMAENVSQAFLGLSIGCARCHNHPLEKWTNDQYYAFANLFSRVQAKGWGGDPRNGDGFRTLVTVSTGELIQPRTGRPLLPSPLDGIPIALDDPRDRRDHLADWLVAPDNPYFSRSITNRVWRNFMGVGLVEEVDDMRVSNPASNEELLTALSDSLVAEGFDLKSLMRLILQSETYQRSSETLPENRGDVRHYSRWFPRRLMAEVLLDAVSQVTDVASSFTEIRFPGGNVEQTDYYPSGTSAIQLYDSAVDSYFLKTFGRNQRRITCECERSDEPSMVQVLHIANGMTLNEKLAASDNRITCWQQEMDDDGSLLDEMFLTALARFPEPKERQELLSLLRNTADEDQRMLLEDVLWGMFASREFLFNH